MKKNKFKKLAPLALAGLITIGASAWLTTSDLADKTQSITAGTFAISLSNEDAAILDENAIPVSDAVGKAGTPYTFTVTNTGTIKEAVRLAVATTDRTEELASNLINLYVVDGSGNKVYEGTLADADNDKGFGEVAVLAGSEAQTYKVYAWIDDAATNDNLFTTADDGTMTGKVNQFKLEVLAVQADGGIEGSTSAKSAYTEAEFETAATAASLTRTSVGN